jgi:hypothetical protein
MIEKIRDLVRRYGNDYELGKRVRQLIYGEQCKTNSRRTEHDSDSV